MFKRKQKSKEPICPFLKGECIKHECILYTNIVGTHPQTGEIINQWDCSLKILPLLMIEQTKHIREVKKVSEQNRNENAKSREVILNALLLQRKGANFVSNIELLEENNSFKRIEGNKDE